MMVEPYHQHRLEMRHNVQVEVLAHRMQAAHLGVEGGAQEDEAVTHD